MLRSVDDQRVHRRHVDAGLDDGRAHQARRRHPPRNRSPPVSRVRLVHLTMGHGHPGLGDEIAQPSGNVSRCSGNPVVDEEHLAFTQELPADGLGDGTLVVFADIGQDRLPISRCGVCKHGQVPNAGECSSPVSAGWVWPLKVNTSTAVPPSADQFGVPDLAGSSGPQALQCLLVLDAEPLIFDRRSDQAQPLGISHVARTACRCVPMIRSTWPARGGLADHLP